MLGEKTAGRLLSATSVKVGHGFRLALPTGAYYTWNLTALEGTPLEPDIADEFDLKIRKAGEDRPLQRAMAYLSGELAESGGGGKEEKRALNGGASGSLAEVTCALAGAGGA